MEMQDRDKIVDMENNPQQNSKIKSEIFQTQSNQEIDYEQQIDQQIEYVNKRPIKLLFFTFFSIFTVTLFVILIAQSLNFIKNQKENQLYIPQNFSENNSFDYFQLDNKLKVLLVNPNSEIKQSYISISVGVGTQTDPDNFIGLTHLIEHMTFKGSEKYPGGDYITEFFAKNQGDCNASTQDFLTNYYCKIGNDSLTQLLDILASAIKKPNFEEKYVKNEINNINSEISMRMTFNKNMAYFKLLQIIGNKKSRIFYNGFANIDVDKVDTKKLKQQIQDFHDKYYSSNIMTLVVISNMENHLIKNKIKKEFSKIQNLNISRPQTSIQEQTKLIQEKPFNKNILRNIYYLNTSQPKTKLTLYFTIPSEISETNFQASQFFGQLLLLYTKNSFMHQLFTQNIISKLEQFIIEENYAYSVYLIRFNLIDQKQTQITKILEKLTQFVNYLRTNKNIEKLYNQYRKFTIYNFFYNLENQIIKVNLLEKDMQERGNKFSKYLLSEEPEGLFTSQSIYNKFDKVKWEKFLDSINIQDSVYLIESNKFSVNTNNKGKLISKVFEGNKINYRILKMKLDLDKNNNQNPSSKLSDFFDFFSQQIELKDRIDINNQERVKIQNVPEILFSQFKNKIPKREFEISESMFSDLPQEVQLYSQCIVPQFLQGSQEISNKNYKVEVQKLIDLLFFKTKKQLLQNVGIQDQLLEYKKCLKVEFQNDLNTTQPIKLNEQNSQNVYMKIFRNNFQPLIQLNMNIKNKYIYQNILNNKDIYDRTKYILIMQIFCQHFQLILFQENINYFSNGNSFTCEYSNDQLKLFISSPNDKFQEFASFIFESINKYNKNINKAQQQLENVKQFIIDNLYEYLTFDSLKKTKKLLSQMIDRQSIQFINEDEQTKILEIISSITMKDLVELSQSISKYYKINFLYVGNFNKQEILKNHDELLKNLDEQKLSLVYQDINNYDQKIDMHNSIISQQVMYRFQNQNKDDFNKSFFMYIDLGILKKEQIMYLKTINYYLNNHIYNQIREKQNLGYVANSIINENHQHTGLLFIINGYKLDPTSLEEIIFKCINEFQELQNTENEILDITRKLIIQNNNINQQLCKVSEMINNNLHQSIKSDDYQEFNEVFKGFLIKKYQEFQKQLFTKPSYIILEMSNNLKEEQKKFIISADKTVGQTEYKIQDYFQDRMNYFNHQLNEL